jgi:hypothetical protein
MESLGVIFHSMFLSGVTHCILVYIMLWRISILLPSINKYFEESRNGAKEDLYERDEVFRFFVRVKKANYKAKDEMKVRRKILRFGGRSKV